MADSTLVVHGYREFVRACALSDKKTKKAVRERFRRVGQLVQEEATKEFSDYGTGPVSGGFYGGSRASHAYSAEHYRTRVRQRGVEVEQSLRKTTGLHPEYGSVQMRHGLIPAAALKEPEVVAEFDAAISEVVTYFDRV